MDAITNRHLEGLLHRLRGPLAEAAKSKNPPKAAEQLDAFLTDLVSSVCQRLQCDDDDVEETAVELVVSVLATLTDEGKLDEIPDAETASPEEIMLWLATAQQLQVAAHVLQAADEVLAELDAEDAQEWEEEEWE